MKKLRIWLVTLLTCCLAICCFVACGKNYAGTYKFQSMKGEMGGMSVELEVGEEFMGIITLTEDYYVLELEDDGTATMTVNATEEISMEGTWAVNEDDSSKIDITFEGETATATIDGELLVLEQDGMELVLKKS